MKSISVVAVALLASMGAAQGLSGCATGCIERVVRIRQEQCGGNDTACVCSSPDLVNGIRDCTNEACSKEDTAAAIASGTAICKDITPPDGSQSNTATGTQTGPNTGANTGTQTGTNTGGVPVPTSGEPTGTGAPTGTETNVPTGTEGGNESSTPIATVSPTTAVVTSGTQILTSTFTGTTIFGGGNGTATSTGGSGSATSSGSPAGSGSESSSPTEGGENPTESGGAGGAGENAATKATVTFGLAGALGLMAMFAL